MTKPAKGAARRGSKPQGSAPTRQGFKAADYIAIWQRSDGICGICNLPVDPAVISIDHIVPISGGGVHQIDNWQLAHRSCNASKGGVRRSRPSKPAPPPREAIPEAQLFSLAHGPGKSVSVPIKEIMALCDMSRDAIYDALGRGQIPGFKVGTKWIIPRPAFETWWATAGGTVRPARVAGAKRYRKHGRVPLPLRRRA